MQEVEKLRVLLLDDDPLVRLLAEQMLGANGMEVQAFSHCRDAFAALERYSPDAVLLDVQLPHMSGFECLEELQRRCPDAPIIMLTGMDDADSIARAFEMGAADFFPKPIQWPILLNRLRFTVRASRDRQHLRESRAMLEKTQHIARLGSWACRIGYEWMTCSDEVYALLGIGREAFNVSFEDFFGHVLPEDVAKLQQAFRICAADGHKFDLDLEVADGGRRNRILHIQGGREYRNGDGHILTGTLQDITEFRHFEAEVHRLSFYDSLTGLPNRALFKEVLGQAIGYCRRYQTQLGVLFIGLKKFRLINESFGPRSGDVLLQQFAKRLVQEVRGSDDGAVPGTEDAAGMTISRLAGDEFTVLINHVNGAHDVVRIAERICNMMGTPFSLGDQELHMNISMGIAIFPGDGADADDMVRNGESAMQAARELEHNNYQFHSAARSQSAFHKLSMENHLRAALSQDQYRLHFQPQIDAASGKVCGAEALLRWQHPEVGLLAPAHFMPVLEESGSMVAVGAMVINKALQQLGEWDAAGLPPLTMSINVSPAQLRHTGFIQHLRGALAANGTDPRRIELEITETQMMLDAIGSLKLLGELAEVGVKIAVDDFGTGYSSLSYLKRFPISTLKIDRTFITEMPHSREDVAIVDAILALSGSLGLSTVAEGIENREQARFLRNAGCHRFQGFFFARPMAAEQFAALVLTGAAQGGMAERQIHD